MIDYSKLVNSSPNISYDTTDLLAEGLALKFALDSRNPEYQNVLDECKKRNLLYKIKDGDGNQKHIWIKDWKKE